MMFLLQKEQCLILEFIAFVMNVDQSGLSNMAYWKKGKMFRKGNRTVRYIYKNGSKRNKRLVTVSSRKRSNYRRKRY